MMTIVHYTTEHSTFCCIKGNALSERVIAISEIDEGPAIKCCEIDGDDWEDCMAKYHEHMEWEPYVPMDDD